MLRYLVVMGHSGKHLFLAVIKRNKSNKKKQATDNMQQHE